jgi:hypothetical protein
MLGRCMGSGCACWPDSVKCPQGCCMHGCVCVCVCEFDCESSGAVHPLLLSLVYMHCHACAVCPTASGYTPEAVCSCVHIAPNLHKHLTHTPVRVYTTSGDTPHACSSTAPLVAVGGCAWSDCMAQLHGTRGNCMTNHVGSMRMCKGCSARWPASRVKHLLEQRMQAASQLPLGASHTHAGQGSTHA